MSDKAINCDLNLCQEIGKSCAVFNLRKASRAVTQIYEEVMKPSGVLPTQFTLLVVTKAMQPIAISKMAEVLVMDRTTLTRNLRPLERDGMLAVKPDRQDKRARVVTLTKQGLAHLELALPLWQEAQERIRESLGSRRLDRIIEDLTAIVSVATEK
ncbi:MAG: MarR family transcriptional regulator [Candidatus Thiodiazotropha sp.]